MCHSWSDNCSRYSAESLEHLLGLNIVFIKFSYIELSDIKKRQDHEECYGTTNDCQP